MYLGGTHIFGITVEIESGYVSGEGGGGVGKGSSQVLQQLPQLSPMKLKHALLSEVGNPGGGEPGTQFPSPAAAAAI